MSAADPVKYFLEHKKRLDDIRRKGLGSTSEDSYDAEFTKIRELSQSYKTNNVFSFAEGTKRFNVSKNRFKDIVPFDHSRVVLKNLKDGATSDYINASTIKGAVGDQMYIAAQGPLPKTVNDFWQMIWENNVRVMFMACREYEEDPPKLKCQRYWPSSTDEEMSFGDVTVTLDKEEMTPYKEHKIRHMIAKVGVEKRKIVQFHYLEWPDSSVASCVSSIIYLVEKMREIQPVNAKETSPVLINCSAGCGRTGSVLVIDFVLSLLKCGKLKPDFKLYDIVVEMRKQRMAIIQSLEQYIFVHDVIEKLFTQHLPSPKTLPASSVNAISLDYEIVGQNISGQISRQKSYAQDNKPREKPPTIAFPPKKQPTTTVNSDVVQVIYKGINISYPNRVSKPCGKRSLLTIHVGVKPPAAICLA